MKDNRWAMLCKLKVAAFDNPLWRWERKLDGCRMRVDISRDGNVKLAARSGADKTAQFPELAFAHRLSALPASIDGEVVSADGLSFQEFNQRRMNRTEGVALMARRLPAMFVAFDIIECWGKSLRLLPLQMRRDILLGFSSTLHVSEQYKDGVELFERAWREGWEGVVGKRLDEPYLPNKRAWVKVKVWLPPKDYYVIGFTRGTGKRAGLFGAFMLGEWDTATGGLRHVGDCGTGLDDAGLREWDAVRREHPVYCCLELGRPLLGASDPRYLRAVRVKAVEVTNAGSLRFPVYLGPGGRQERQNENPGALG